MQKEGALSLSSKKKLLIICNSLFISGGELNLFQFLKYYDKKKYEVVLILPNKSIDFNNELTQCNVIEIPLIWFKRSLNPLYLIKCLINIIYCSLKIRKIIHDKKIDIIYSNSIKSHIYGSIIKLLTGKKAIWHVRDNFKKGFFNNFLIKYSDKIICISEYIYQQIKVPEKSKEIIYGGIDTHEWSPMQDTKKNDLRMALGLSLKTKLVAQVSQITSWKNHLDFIKSAVEIIQDCTIEVHFLIVGDDLSGKEKRYKKQIETEILKAGLEKHFSFLGFIKDIKEIYAQIDVLVHPAINEPFGRAIIEAMAMGKPVVAYNCGGPKEIVINNKTGYLIEPYDYRGLAEKTIQLLESRELRIKFGKAGRTRVIEKFNIERYVKKMEEIFESI
jgi:glycosyltransferase involved in cell wall biosynthesis